KFMDWCIDKYEKRYTEVFVDPACRSLREELHMKGILTKRADKNDQDEKTQDGGIEVGIERFQNSITNEQFFLVETDRYDHYDFAKEIGMYVRDDNGNPIDDWNHAMDEARYANNYFYRRYVL